MCEGVCDGLAAGKRKDPGSVPLRFSSAFRSCGLWTLSLELRKRMKVEMDVLDSPVPNSPKVSLDVKQQ